MRGLRERISATASQPLLIPGGGTPLEALSAQRAQYEAFYLSGYAVAAWRHGLPDILGRPDRGPGVAKTVRPYERQRGHRLRRRPELS